MNRHSINLFASQALLAAGKLLLLLALSPLSSRAQSTDQRIGNYAGILQGVGLPLYFRISGDSLSGYQADFNSPAQKALGLKCSKVTIKGDSLTIEAVAFAAVYRGKYRTDRDSIEGQWQQNGQTLTLSLKKMRRPQTPASPFPYLADSVEYNSSDGSVHLAATLTRPFAQKKYPVAILITGSGLQDRDETIFEHRPFAVIADYLTRQGLAVLRVDDRTKGLSTGDVTSATSADYAGDVITSIDYLKTRQDIDTTRIGVIGHSEGGLIGPIVYTQWPHLRFIVLLAGPGLSGADISFRQQTDPIKSLGQATYEAWQQLVRAKLTILNENYGRPDSLTIRQLKTSFAQWKDSLPDSIATLLHANTATPDAYVQQESINFRPWLRYFYKTDPATFLRQVHCPVLALAGAKDQQVDPAENIPVIQAALRAGGNTTFTSHVFPDLNHLFQHCATGGFSEYATIEESFAPEVLKTMEEWVHQQIR